MKLTDSAIRKAKPESKTRKLADGGGLYLEIAPNGSKYWRMKYRVSGREKRLAFGVYPAVTLARARAKRDEARRLLANGIDPGEVKKSQKRDAAHASANSFEAVAREWHTLNASRWTPRHAHDVIDSLEKEVFPLIGDAPLSDIDAPGVLDVIRKIEGRCAFDVAGRVMQRIRAVFAFAMASGRVRHNPAVEARGAMAPRPKKGHYPSIEDPREIPAFMSALAAYWQEVNASPIVRIATRMLAYTFVRTGELRGSRWDEFDLENRMWSVPAERMKAREPHLVPLSAQVLALLVELRPYAGNSPLLFPGRVSIKKPISDNSINMVIKRAGYAGRMCGHGFRSMASTFLNELGTIRPDVIEAQLAHKDQNAVRAAYNRASYMSYRVAMMQFWADSLDAMEKGEKLPAWEKYEPNLMAYQSAQVVHLSGQKMS